MNTNLIKTFRVINPNGNTDNSVKELDILSINNSKDSLFRNLVNFESQLYNTTNDIHIKDGLIYILKCRDENRIYGVAIFISDNTSPGRCYLYDYGISKCYQARGVEFNFMKNIYISLKTYGFSEIELADDMLNSYFLQSYINKFGMKFFKIINSDSTNPQNRCFIKLNTNY